jgi:hypothetical protein
MESYRVYCSWAHSRLGRKKGGEQSGLLAQGKDGASLSVGSKRAARGLRKGVAARTRVDEDGVVAKRKRRWDSIWLAPEIRRGEAE